MFSVNSKRFTTQFVLCTHTSHVERYNFYSKNCVSDVLNIIFNLYRTILGARRDRSFFFFRDFQKRIEHGSPRRDKITRPLLYFQIESITNIRVIEIKKYGFFI